MNPTNLKVGQGENRKKEATAEPFGKARDPGFGPFDLKLKW